MRLTETENETVEMLTDIICYTLYEKADLNIDTRCKVAIHLIPEKVGYTKSVLIVIFVLLYFNNN